MAHWKTQDIIIVVVVVVVIVIVVGWREFRLRNEIAPPSIAAVTAL
jgi:predicted negative regulator of RcsB-dependent stress response